MSPPSAEGGRLRAQDLRTSGDPLGLGRLPDPDRPGHRSRRARQPARDERRPERAPHARARPAQLAAARDPSRHQRRLAGRLGRRLLGGDQPRPAADRSDPQLRLAVLRGRARPERRAVRARAPAQRRAGPRDLRGPLRRGQRDRRAVLGLRPRARDRARRRLLDRRDRERAGREDLGRSRSIPQAGTFPAAYRGALFFGDELRECMWAMLPGPDGLPERGRVVPFAQAAASPARHRGRARTATCCGSTTDASNVKRIRWTGNAANHAPTAVAARRRRRRATRPLTVHLRRDRLERPRRRRPADPRSGTSTATESSTTRPPLARSTPTLQGGTYTVALRVTDTSGATRHRHVSRSRSRAGRSRRSTRPTASATWKAGRHDRLLRLGDRRRRTARWPPLPSTGASCCVHCAAPGDCHEHPIGTFDETARAARSPRRTTPEPAYDRDPADRHRLRRRDTDTDSVRLNPQVANLTLTVEPARRGGGPERRRPSRRRSPSRSSSSSRNTLSAAPQQTLANVDAPVLVVVGRAAARARR